MRDLGRRFIAEIGPLITDEAYRVRLDEAVKQGTGKFAKDVALNILKRVPRYGHHEPYTVILRFGQSNTAFLDAVSLAG